MQLMNIDKAIYRKHLNIVIVGFISTLLILALIFGQLMIMSFAEEGVNNFKYNLLGVILSLLACMAILHSIKTSAFFKEIYYVWQVKQIQNLIFRKLKKIKLAAKDLDQDALMILTFYYQSQQQVYELDDNTLTITTVNKDLNDLQEKIAEYNLTIDIEQFDKKMISAYA
jgi:hypothetical protein